MRVCTRIRLFIICESKYTEACQLVGNTTAGKENKHRRVFSIEVLVGLKKKKKSCLESCKRVRFEVREVEEETTVRVSNTSNKHTDVKTIEKYTSH